jgi:hypothetical protein
VPGVTPLRFPPAAAALLLAGCVSAPVVESPAPVARPAVRPPPLSGLAAVMGQNARGLELRFGRASLDVREGTARKLQFANQVCVLDAYLYPPTQGAEPVVTYIDTRHPDGRDIDRASCVASLSAR